MKKLLLILFYALLHVSSVHAQDIKKVKISDVQQMIDTATVPLIVNMWATWCGPCVREIPWFESIVSKYKDSKVRIILISLDFPEDFPKSLTAFVKEKGYTSQVVWLDETNADKFCPVIDSTWGGAIPVSLFVNNTKKYRQFFNHQLPEARFELELKKLIE